jgi:pantetheine-phosphate adenylyltransferase
MNRQLAPEVETIFLMTNEDNFFVSSSLVREVAQMGGDITRVVPPGVAAELKKKLSKKRQRID